MIPAPNRKGVRNEKISGMYSCGRRKSFTECAMMMSSDRKVRFPRQNTSIHTTGSNQYGLRSGNLCRNRLTVAAMLTFQLRCHAPQFHHLGDHRVIAMPLHEVGPAHECAVLGSAPVVMPEIEVHEVDRM